MSDFDNVNKIVDNLETELKAMSHKIHDNPELGLHEFKACALQIEILKKYGFSVEEEFCDMKTAYKATYKGKKIGPKIAMLAEYDALPDLGHGCGHNLISMVGVGSGIAMREFADKYGGEVYVIGTPAEETEGAKVEMANKGVFDKIDVAMMAHPAYMNTESLNTLAMNAYKFEFVGKTAHAAGMPEEGINALDAMINFFNLVNALRQETKPDARIHGVITNGGNTPNVIPDYTSAVFYVRAEKSIYLEELSEKVINCAKGAALGTGTTLKYSFTEANFKDTNSNRALSHLYAKEVAKFGINLINLKNYVVPGSSDLGDVSYKCPAIQTAWDITEGKGYGTHTAEFAKCAGEDQAMDSAIRMIKGFVMTAVELMTDPDQMLAIKEEFTHINDANRF